MAAFLDDMPLIAGVNENWDDINTYEQVKRGYFAHQDENHAPFTTNFL